MSRSSSARSSSSSLAPNSSQSSANTTPPEGRWYISDGKTRRELHPLLNEFLSRYLLPKESLRSLWMCILGSIVGLGSTLSVQSCSIKEDRSDCFPGIGPDSPASVLEIDLTRCLVTSDNMVVFVSSSDSIVSRDTVKVSRQDPVFRKALHTEGLHTISILTNKSRTSHMAESSTHGNSSLLIQSPYECDSLWTFKDDVFVTEGVNRVEASLHKDFFTVNLSLSSTRDAYATLECDYSGIELPSLEPIYRPHTYNIYIGSDGKGSIRLSRQRRDSSIRLSIPHQDSSLDISKKMHDSMYDFERSDLRDLNLDIDEGSWTCSLRIIPWEDVDFGTIVVN